MDDRCIFRDDIQEREKETSPMTRPIADEIFPRKIFEFIQAHAESVFLYEAYGGIFRKVRPAPG